jgi:hypothetical protein
MMLNRVADIIRYRIWFFLLLAAGCFVLIYFILDFNGLYGQDGYEYLRFSNRLSGYIKNGIPSGDYFWPVYYPLMGAVVSFLTQSNVLALQLISFFSFLLLIFIFRKYMVFIDNENDLKRDTYLFIFLFLSPYMWRASFLVMSDMMTVMLVLGSFYFLSSFKKEEKYKNLLLFSCCFFLSILTRYAAVVILILPCLTFFFYCFKKIKYQALLIFLLIGLSVLIPHIWIKHNSMQAILSNSFLSDWSVMNFFSSHFENKEGHNDYSFVNILYVAFVLGHPGFIAIGVLLLFFIKREDFENTEYRLVLASVILYLLFLAGIPFQNNRFLLPVFPLILFLYYPAFIRMVESLLKIRVPLFYWALLVLAVQLILCWRALMPFIGYNRLDRTIINKVKIYDHYPQIYNLGMEGALTTYGIKAEIYNIWKVKLVSVKKNSLLLINSHDIEVHWKGMNPDYNLTYIRNNYTLRKLETLPEGWELYEIQ